MCTCRHKSGDPRAELYIIDNRWPNSPAFDFLWITRAIDIRASELTCQPVCQFFWYTSRVDVYYYIRTAIRTQTLKHYSPLPKIIYARYQSLLSSPATSQTMKVFVTGANGYVSHELGYCPEDAFRVRDPPSLVTELALL